MSHPDYKHLSTPEDKVIEECSELIQALCKVKTFGWFNSHPDKPNRSNIDDVESEMSDVIEAIERLNVMIRDIRFQQDMKDKFSSCTKALEAQNIMLRAALELECGDRCNENHN